MTEQHPLVGVTRLFDDLHRKSGIILTAFGHDPMPGSLAAKELTTKGIKHLNSTYSQGTVLIEAAADQLGAFVRGITQPVLTIAPWSNARGVLETTAISVWLLDDKIDSSERIHRSYALRCEGLNQQVKFARAANLPDTGNAEQRLSDVLSQAKSEGLATRDSNGKIVGLAKPMPPVTDLVHDHLNEEASYRLFSAVTHAHLWAVQQVAFRKVNNASKLFLEKGISITSIQYLANTMIGAFRKPIECKCRLFGWPVTGIALMFDEWKRDLDLLFKKSIESRET